MPEWIPVALAILSPLATWWGSSRYFAGVFREWRKSTEVWRLQTDARLEALNLPARATFDENVRLRLNRVEQDVQELDALNSPERVASHEALRLRLDTVEAEVRRLREWKHVRVDPYIQDLENINDRITKVEKAHEHHPDRRSPRP